MLFALGLTLLSGSRDVSNLEYGHVGLDLGHLPSDTVAWATDSQPSLHCLCLFKIILGKDCWLSSPFLACRILQSDTQLLGPWKPLWLHQR